MSESQDSSIKYKFKVSIKTVSILFLILTNILASKHKEIIKILILVIFFCKS